MNKINSLLNSIFSFSVEWINTRFISHPFQRLRFSRHDEQFCIISTFNDMGVAVYEQAPDAEALLLSDNVVTVTSDDDEVEAAAEAAFQPLCDTAAVPTESAAIRIPTPTCVS